MKNDSTLYSSIYLPLVEKYIKGYFDNSWLAQNNYMPEDLDCPCTDGIKRAVNNAYKEGLYEGLNNGFIEGFMKCAEYFDIENEYFINKSNE